MYKQVGVDFDNWLDDYDRKLMNDYQLFVEDAARRNMLKSGVTAKYAIKYFQEFRRIRDNKIDSFLIAYSLAGGDTLNLHYQRKLPTDVHRIIISTWGDLGKDMKDYIGRKWLDTL